MGDADKSGNTERRGDMGLVSDKDDSMGCSESTNTDNVSVEEGVGQSTFIGTSRSVIIID